MMIKDLFVKPIDRDIKGVIKVGQDDSSNVRQELEEYVVTRELQKHFAEFFSSYKRGILGTTDKMGVWISGFFGSGKSHFLKMLSYLLENKEVKGIRSVERFRKKFEDDPATFMLIDRATKGTTETILFNIDIEGFSNKDKTAVLRVFAKMFYNHLGFYGENLKVAMMERYIDQQGKTKNRQKCPHALDHQFSYHLCHTDPPASRTATIARPTPDATASATTTASAIRATPEL